MKNAGRIRTALAAAMVAAALAAATATAAGLGPTTKVTVTPGSGGPTTHFRFSFRIPVATGTSGSLTRTDTFSVHGPRGAYCQSSVTRALRPARKGKRVRLTLRPAKGRGGWCSGQWHGTVVQSLAVRCTPGPASVCPQLVIAPRTIARFRFRVKQPASHAPPPSPSGDVPTFGGLTSATTCPSPQPVRAKLLPQPSRYTLTWTAGTDPVTPSAQLVYQIFAATSPGAEDYSAPTYETSPGATSYVTPGLPRDGTEYFVVRARNAAGREDANTIEKQGAISCPPVMRPQG